MKIGFVCPYDWSRPGGVQRHIADCAKLLNAAGYEVRIIVPDLNKPEKDNYIIPFGRAYSIAFNKTQMELSWASKQSIYHLLESEKFDILHFHSIWDPFLSTQLFWYAQCACIATFHDTPPDTLMGKMTRQLFKLTSPTILRKLDAAIAVSTAPAKHLRAPDNNPLHIIPPCIDLSAYQRLSPHTHKPGTNYRILFVGRLDKRKGVHILIDAFEQLYSLRTDVELVIAGHGQEYSHLKAMAKKLSSYKAINFSGNITEDKKLILLANADIFCSPALYGESFGLVLAEAMASGLPVVAANNTGYSTLLAKQADDCLFESGNSEQLTRKIQHLLDNQKRRAQLSNWGKQYMRQFDCILWLSIFEEIYHDVVNTYCRKK